MLRCYCLLMLLVCSGAHGYAQQQLLRHYTVNEGLPSNTVYSAFQDSRGFIWFCTNWGVSRFDGHYFENITSKQGLPDNETFNMIEDPWHRHWLLSYNRRPGYIFNDKVYAAGNDILCRDIEQAGMRYNHFCYNTDKEFCLIGKSTYIVKKDRIVVADSGQHFPATSLPFRYNGIEYLVDPDRILKKSGSRWDTVLTGRSINNFFYQGHLYSVFLDDQLLRTQTKYFYDISFTGPRPVVKRVKTAYRILRFVPGKDGEMLCCTEAGIFAYRPEMKDIGSEPALMHIQAAASHFFTDVQGNIWYLTAGDGVYMQSVYDVKLYNLKTGLNKDNVLSVCFTPDGKLLAGYDNGVIDQIEGDKITSLKVRSYNLWNRILYMLPVNKDELIVGTDIGLYRINRLSGENVPIVTNAQKAGFCRNNICLIGSNDWRHGGGAVYDIARDKLHYLPAVAVTRVVTATAIDDEETYWMGTLNGLYYCRENIVRKWTGDSSLSECHITSLVVTQNGKLIVSTPTDGLYILDKHRLMLHLDERKGLVSSLCSKVCMDEQGRIWVCTDKGVDRITLTDDLNYTIHHLSAAEGVPSHIINDIAFAGGKAYLATTEGIIVINQDQMDVTIPSQVYILSLAHKDSLINYPQKVTLKYDQNNVVISYTGISYVAGNDITYRYLLRGSNGNDTVQTAQSTLTLGALKPGSYELTVWAAGKNNNWSKSSATLYLTILPPFWLEIWFIALMILIVLILLLLIYKRRIDSVRRKEAEQARRRRKMAELEMQALRAQINPHFMFNALNAIQHYYSQNDERTANYYMSAFARLVRQTLNYSKEHWIALADEMSMLRTYIELEQMRSKHTFSYKIALDPELEQKKIPTMLLQIYTENAINHGLRHLDGLQGELTIAISKDEGRILCKIEDNGVGFVRARELDSRPGHYKSMGLKITAGRIATINELYHIRITVNISDKNTLHGYGHGTIVTITIPFK